ncbi:MAG: c-type cytochrome biogenesis protein CcsB [Kiritimatiellae bacterium]|nr:c-type cytochrome biogenesis protein CcsB [Kiritimatiellia bacterium]
MMTTLFNLCFAIYLLALVTAAIALFAWRKPLSWVSIGALSAGALLQTVYIGMRWVEAGRAPFSNMFESLVLFAWALAVVYLVVRARINIPALSTATCLMVLLVMAYASAFESDIKPLMPALQSNWLSVHVFTCFLGYSGFAISFLSAIGFLVIARANSKCPDETKNNIDMVTAKTISFGFLFLTVGIITGAVWANSAWGTYWSWDPKETWSLITWFVYAIFLHCRYMRGWHGRRAAWIAIFGFCCVLFTYFGVSRWLPGLHSYA